MQHKTIFRPLSCHMEIVLGRNGRQFFFKKKKKKLNKIYDRPL